MNAVSTEGLTKQFRDFWFRPKVRALDGLNLSVPEGEVFGLLGPNGSGKSTTIKLLLGLLHPTAGHATVLSAPAGAVAAKRHIGYLPEESHLYRHLTARETVTLHGRLSGLGGRQLRARVGELLELTGLTQAADRAVGEFSKGMGRRVGLAQALVGDPKLVILDEPTAGLDPIGCREVKDLITELASQGKTVLLTSHLLADVEDVCDQLMILYRGRTLAAGSIRELLQKQNEVRLTLPRLPEPALEALCRDITAACGHTPVIEYPGMGLEAFFLSVIQQAESA